MFRSSVLSLTKIEGWDSLIAWWLRFGTLTAEAQALSLNGEPCHLPGGVAKIKKKKIVAGGTVC